jgi:hypothetical protein
MDQDLRASIRNFCSRYTAELLLGRQCCGGGLNTLGSLWRYCLSSWGWPSSRNVLPERVPRARAALSRDRVPKDLDGVMHIPVSYLNPDDESVCLLLLAERGRWGQPELVCSPKVPVEIRRGPAGGRLATAGGIPAALRWGPQDRERTSTDSRGGGRTRWTEERVTLPAGSLYANSVAAHSTQYLPSNNTTLGLVLVSAHTPLWPPPARVTGPGSRRFPWSSCTPSGARRARTFGGSDTEPEIETAWHRTARERGGAARRVGRDPAPPPRSTFRPATRPELGWYVRVVRRPYR